MLLRPPPIWERETEREWRPGKLSCVPERSRAEAAPWLKNATSLTLDERGVDKKKQFKENH